MPKIKPISVRPTDALRTQLDALRGDVGPSTFATQLVAEAVARRLKLKTVPPAWITRGIGEWDRPTSPPAGS